LIFWVIYKAKKAGLKIIKLQMIETKDIDKLRKYYENLGFMSDIKNLKLMSMDISGDIILPNTLSFETRESIIKGGKNNKRYILYNGKKYIVKKSGMYNYIKDKLNIIYLKDIKGKYVFIKENRQARL
jgi:hypothetical protein